MVISKYRKVWCLWCAFFALTPAFAQQTGNLTGTVVDELGGPLPGITVLLESPALQGSRTLVTAEKGLFLARLLPPGTYQITATMTGFQTLKQEARVTIGATARVRMVMRPESTQEVLIVTADRETALDTHQISSNFDGDFVEKLPRARDLESIATLAPGVTNGPVNSGISINGAASTENVFMLNGAFINQDGIRGAADDLFIEDDIEETQVITGNASAEFGFFAGGMVNSITKSGGNEFHGTFRTQLSNEDWTARNPLELQAGSENVDKINKEFTFTANGPIIKDRLWFATSGRKFDTEITNQLQQGSPLSDEQAQALGLPTGQTAPGAESFNTETTRTRMQLKLTGTLYEGHTLVASYLEDEVDVAERQVFSSLDRGALAPNSAYPSDLTTLNYRGLLSPALTVDANYAIRNSSLQTGFADSDRISGTNLVHRDQNSAFSHAPFGNGATNQRNSHNWNLKFSYFLNTPKLGSHDITFGGQGITEERNENNHQSPNGWQLRPRWTRWDGDQVVPIFTPGTDDATAAWILYFPVANISQGSDFTTRAAFLNDVWTLNEHFFFNVGLRYSQNRTAAEDGQELSSTNNLSPRLTATLDPFGDGVHQVSLGYNVYEGKLNDAAQDGSTAGTPAVIQWLYNGPQTEQIADVFQWMEENFEGGVAAAEALDPDVLNNQWSIYNTYTPEVTPEALPIVVGEGGLDGVEVTEFSLGYKQKLGNRGYFKTDFILREYGNFLARNINSTTGRTTNGVDRTVLANDNGNYERDYKGFNLSGQYRFADNFNLGGNYTFAQTNTNIVGETSGSGAVATSTTTTYPEFNHPRTNLTGLAEDMSEHSLRLWAAYDLNTTVGDFTFSTLASYFSGTPYGMSYSIPIRGRETEFGLPDPATLPYRSPPRSINYDITDPDALKWDAMTSVDLGVNYSLRLMNRYELFMQIDINNLFNSDSQIDGNKTVSAISGAPAFDLATETPVEGVHYQRGSRFGQGTVAAHYQNPRTITIDLGFKF
ncbi:TonB-dependent receptor [Acanthopleuribacter pedis]|uniref:TonB-dependent receptor n=1 Tax=Acanthopleuribacter pedis TaxID=442870 RepID=A0A8J7U6D6_9BACT|nr:TonB-dependent receptor [Acanthopleuribacter pedis]MBO1322682.1 TonB-dependent receptor [Acanthopleuribacter pedis]